MADQDSPFWTVEAGGCIKSLKGPRASFSAELTSGEEHVMHSTRVGYREITWAHVLLSTVGSHEKNKEEKEKTKNKIKEKNKTNKTKKRNEKKKT